MVTFPNAKINLGLRVLKKRNDGYHDIESCFVPIKWCDVLEINKEEKGKITHSGLSIPGSDSENLCLKAYRLINERYSIAPVHIHLHKVIPLGAGLGGGSSDAAFTIRMINDLFLLKLDLQEMELIASEVGSDCPFFIRNQPSIARGRGTDLKTITPYLSGKFILLIHPEIHISTAEAYSNLNIGKIKSEPESIEDVLQQPVSKWKHSLSNDFEEYAFKKYPEISELKNYLYSAGAIYSSMTGSGAAVYGIFNDKESVPDIPASLGKHVSWKGNL